MSLRAWALALKRDALAVWLAGRDARTPWLARAVALAVAAYAFSPIDLIPDFIPVLGLLDDLLIVPAGLWLALRLIPADVLAEHRAAAAVLASKPVSKAAAAVIAGVWFALAAATAFALVHRLR